MAHRISITIPDDIAPRVFDAIAAVYGYDPKNEEHGTKEEFTNATVAQIVSDVVRSYEERKAADAARVRAHKKAEKEIQL